jgi:hypothetical protein
MEKKEAIRGQLGLPSLPTALPPICHASGGLSGLEGAGDTDLSSVGGFPFLSLGDDKAVEIP